MFCGRLDSFSAEGSPSGLQCRQSWLVRLPLPSFSLSFSLYCICVSIFSSAASRLEFYYSHCLEFKRARAYMTSHNIFTANTCRDLSVVKWVFSLPLLSRILFLSFFLFCQIWFQHFHKKVISESLYLYSNNIAVLITGETYMLRVWKLKSTEQRVELDLNMSDMTSGTLSRTGIHKHDLKQNSVDS